MLSEKKQLFEAIFASYFTLSDEAYAYLDNSFVEKTYAAREIIVEAGGLAKYFYLVISGVQALYLIDKRGEKVVLGFSFNGSPSGAFDSFITGKPSHFFLEALTPSRMIAISKDSFDKLFENFPEFYRWRGYFMEEILLGRISREVEIMTLTAKERFDAFVARCPEELNQIPQKYLASYLNMKPETFSRLRALKD